METVQELLGFIDRSVPVVGIYAGFILVYAVCLGCVLLFVVAWAYSKWGDLRVWLWFETKAVQVVPQATQEHEEEGIRSFWAVKKFHPDGTDDPREKEFRYKVSVNRQLYWSLAVFFLSFAFIAPFIFPLVGISAWWVLLTSPVCMGLFMLLSYVYERMTKHRKRHAPQHTPGMEYAAMNPQRLIDALERLANELEAFVSSGLEAILDFLESVRQWATDAVIRVKNYLIRFSKLAWRVSVALLKVGLFYSPCVVFGITFYYTGSFLWLFLAFIWFFAITAIILFWKPQLTLQK